MSEIAERLWAEYETFASRELSEFEIIYPFVDGIAERVHLGQPREAVLAAWGILADGKKALLHLAPGTKEDTASCKEFFQDMRRRGLPDPLLLVSDGAPALIRAIEECFPRAARQRCLAHKLRNLQSKVPEHVWPEFKARAVACYQAASAALARVLRDDIATTYSRDLPSVVACFNDDFQARASPTCAFPSAIAARSAPNLLEQLFGEERRRTKVIPHAFDERAVLKLIYAALIRAAERWRGIRITQFEQRQLKAIRDELDDEFTRRNAPVTTAIAAAPNSFIQHGPDLTACACPHRSESRCGPCDVQREEQPILIVDECRIDFVLYGIALAAELRALIGNLDRFAFLIFPIVRDRVDLRVPFPRARKFGTGKFHAPDVADSFDLPKRIEVVGLGHLFGNRWALLRPRRRREDQQQHAEG